MPLIVAAIPAAAVETVGTLAAVCSTTAATEVLSALISSAAAATVLARPETPSARPETPVDTPADLILIFGIAMPNARVYDGRLHRFGQPEIGSIFMQQVEARARALLIGSLPLTNHQQAMALVMQYSPDIPCWPQLPAHPHEKMIPQFMPGYPGAVFGPGKVFVDTAAASFESELLAFYEDYMAVVEGQLPLETSRFALRRDTAPGFFSLLAHLQQPGFAPRALKGQVTGPVTFCTGLKDVHGRAIFFDEQLRDAAVKLLALNARFQVEHLSSQGCPVIVFIDEPALAGFGSSELISVTRAQIAACLEEVAAAIHQAGGLAGIHVCANTDWGLVLESELDIVNFDAYGYFDRFVLSRDQVVKFMDDGGILAWGIVPTLDADDIAREDAASLKKRWDQAVRQLTDLGLDFEKVASQSLITPSCGTGALTKAQAVRVLATNRALSEAIRAGR